MHVPNCTSAPVLHVHLHGYPHMHEHTCMHVLCMRGGKARSRASYYMYVCVCGAGVRHVLLLAGDNETPAGIYASSLDVLSSGLLQHYGITQGLWRGL
jgi:hypothetical protein